MQNARLRKYLMDSFCVDENQLTEWARQEPYMNYMLHVVAPKDMGELMRMLRDLAMRRGKGREQAALYLGITPDSFITLIDNKLIRPFLLQENEIYLEFILNAFMSKYIGRDKLFSNLTTQRVYFITQFNQAHKKDGLRLRPEQCAALDGHIAAEVCSNPDCVAGGPPRRVCLAHGMFIVTRKPAYLRPDILCHVCTELEIRKNPESRRFRFMQDDASVKAWLKRKK